MLGEERRRRIAEFLREEEGIRVGVLSEELGVSRMTVRRDLVEMERAGELIRVRGGAVRKVPRLAFDQRADKGAFAKARIAEALVGMISEDETLILDTGTTTHFVARELRRFSNLTVITNSINAALELHHNSQNKVFLSGGLLYGESELSLIGHLTASAFGGFSVDRAILGCGGVSVGRGFTYYDTQEVQARLAMIESARELVMVADDSKFGREQLISLAPLERADVIVTNSKPPVPFPDQLENREVRLVIADEQTGGRDVEKHEKDERGA